MMPDKEKVIKGLECCEREECSSDCPYWNGSIIDASCITKVMGDAIALLKEQAERIETLESLRMIEQEGR